MATSNPTLPPPGAKRSLLGPAATVATILALVGLVVLIWHGAPLKTPDAPNGAVSLQLAMSPGEARTIVDGWRSTPDPRTSTPTWSQHAFQGVVRLLHPDWKPPATLLDLARNGLWFDSFLIPLYTLALLLSGLWALRATRVRPPQAPAAGAVRDPSVWPTAVPAVFIAVVVLTAFCDLVENWLIGTELGVADWTPLHPLFSALPQSCQNWVRTYAVTLARGFAMTKFVLFVAAFLFVVAFAGAAWRIRRPPGASREADGPTPAGTGQPTSDAKELPVPSGPGCFKDLYEIETKAIFQARDGGAPTVDTPIVPTPGSSGEPWVSFRSSELTGLAFSGGGIRSATFNLGVLQELARLKVLPLIDYVSTVSGGGYVAGFWSAWLTRPGDTTSVQTSQRLEAEARKFPGPEGSSRSDPIRHLREFSQFLAPKWGFFEVEMWHALVAVIAGLLPALTIALSALGFAWILWLSLSFSLACPDPMAAAFVAAGLTAAGMYLFEVWWRRTKAGGPSSSTTPAEERAASVYRLTAFVACGLVFALQALVPWAYAKWLATPWPVYVDGVLRRDVAASGFERWWNLSGIEALGGWLFSPRLFDGTVVWLTAALVFVAIRLAHTGRPAPWTPATLAAFDRVLMRLLGLAIASFGLALIWQLTVNFRFVPQMIAATAVSGGLFAAMRNWIGLAFRRPAKARFLERFKPFVPQLLAYLTIVLAAMGVGSLLIEMAETDWFAWFVAAAVMATVLVLALFIDPGTFGLHAFYRDRIGRAYLGASNPRLAEVDVNRRTDPHDDDDLPLERLQDRPLHLVCCAANDLDGDPIGTLSRGARSATLSKHAVAIGDDYSRPRGITLAAAITASAAAFNSNMGSVSMRVGPAVSFLMSALNLRLGLWVRHPLAFSPLPRRWPGLLFYREMVGMTAATGAAPAAGETMPVMRRDVHLSDGAHFENLGLYELVRRHCRYVILSDCTADPEVAFDDLGNAFRRIREDFGVEIEIDIDPLRPGPDGSSRQHVAVGTIAYSSSDRGVLIYVKPTLTGDEPPDVLQYRSRNRAFPHEGTGDQFYDEAQWEAYRRLGSHAAGTIFAFMSDWQPAALTANWLFVQARSAWYPTPPGLKETVLRMTSRFGEVEGEIKSEQQAGVLREVFPELAAFQSAPPPAGADNGDAGIPAPTTVADLTSLLRITQLMEDVWLACELDRWWHHPVNLGWINMFARWATAPTFRFWWPLLGPMFSPGFRLFLEQRFAVVHDATVEERGRVRVMTAQDGPAREPGLAETWWRTRSRQPLDWKDRTVLEYVRELPRPYGDRSQVTLQLGIVACATSGRSAGWTNNDFFVPPSLWGAGIGGDMLQLVLDALESSPAGHDTCYILVRAPEQATPSEGQPARPGTSAASPGSRAALFDNREFIEQYRKAGFRQLARTGKDDAATAGARAFFSACGVPPADGDTYLEKRLRESSVPDARPRQ